MDLKFPIIEMEAIKGLQASWEMYIIKKIAKYFLFYNIHILFFFEKEERENDSEWKFLPSTSSPHKCSYGCDGLGWS